MSDRESITRMVEQQGQLEEKEEFLGDAHLPRTQEGSWCWGGQVHQMRKESMGR